MRNVMGRSPVHPALLVLAKGSFTFSWAILVLRLAGVDLLGVTFEPARLAALVALLAGTVVLVAALVRLGGAARVGLPRDFERTTLRTTGPYALSRNPVYTAVVGVCLASCAYVPHWLNFAATLSTAALHHVIVRREERFLEGRFGAEWRTYRQRVRRYL